MPGSVLHILGAAALAFVLWFFLRISKYPKQCAFCIKDGKICINGFVKKCFLTDDIAYVQLSYSKTGRRGNYHAYMRIVKKDNTMSRYFIIDSSVYTKSLVAFNNKEHVISAMEKAKEIITAQGLLCEIDYKQKSIWKS